MEAVPSPPQHLFLGHLPLLLKGPGVIQAFMAIAREWGEIVDLNLRRRVLLVSGANLVAEVCDEKRFDKAVGAPLEELRAVVGDALFTAYPDEPNWTIAHEVLIPAFGRNEMHTYLPLMVEVARQMLDSWESGQTVDVAEQMTRLTFDTIGLCGFGYRFDSFARAELHPFVGAMMGALTEAQQRIVYPAIVNELRFGAKRQFERDIRLLDQTVDAIVAERRRHGPGKDGDLLDRMLLGRDAKGRALDDVNIRHQIITFLIAGHETTSGLLSFAVHYLLANPRILEQCVAEADAVLGDDPTWDQVTRLKLVGRVLKEALRIWPTAPAFARQAKEDVVLDGRFAVPKGLEILVLIPQLHRDPRVWEDPERFDPDRFLPERERALPEHAYKPFGTGKRACIGRQFALVEATLVLGMLLRRFELAGEPGWEMRVKETLTLKPDGLKVTVRAREPLPRRDGPAVTAPAAPQATVARHGHALTVLYGSNMGSSASLATRLAEEARHRGYDADVRPLDEAVGAMPRAAVVVCSTYNGLPPDNAGAFVKWVDGEPSLAGVRYAVFGCGNSDWRTFQAVPRRIDQRLAAAGATRLVPAGEGDMADDFDHAFEAWSRLLWPALGAALGVGDDGRTAQADRQLAVEIVADRGVNPFVASFGARPMRVLENRELQAPGSGRSTRHLEIELPEGTSYRTGDHMGIIPRNPDLLVGRVSARFGFDRDTTLRIRQVGGRATHLPLDQAISVHELLSVYVELQDTATRKQLRALALATGCPYTRRELAKLAGDDEANDRYRTHVLEPRRTLLEVLEQYAAIELSFDAFLEMLPPLRPRYYSISSSPLVQAHTASITVGVVHGRRSDGICSTWLAGKTAGSRVHAFVRDNGSAFRPPDDAAVPIVMVGAGTGLAPFRGFLQERLALKTRGIEVGPALLFFGCRRRDADLLYAEELHRLEESGVVRMVTAFSRESDTKVHVQHRMREHAAGIRELLDAAGLVYVCGDASRMEPGVRAALAEVAGRDETWVAGLQEAGRYRVDVWASG